MNPYRIINTRKHGGYHKRTLCRRIIERAESITQSYIHDIFACMLYLQRVLFNTNIANL